MVRVEVRSDGQPVPDALIVAGTVSGATDTRGLAQLRVPAGAQRITVSKDGYLTAMAEVTLAAGGEAEVAVELSRTLLVEEEVTVVASTRTGRRLEDQPTRVEVLGRDEIEEKMLMTPGDIVTSGRWPTATGRATIPR